MASSVKTGPYHKRNADTSFCLELCNIRRSSIKWHQIPEVCLDFQGVHPILSLLHNLRFPYAFRWYLIWDYRSMLVLHLKGIHYFKLIFTVYLLLYLFVKALLDFLSPWCYEFFHNFSSPEVMISSAPLMAGGRGKSS